LFLIVNSSVLDNPDNNLNVTFLVGAMCMQSRAPKDIPSQDAFSMSEFDIVIYRNRELGEEALEKCL